MVPFGNWKWKKISDLEFSKKSNTQAKIESIGNSFKYWIRQRLKMLNLQAFSYFGVKVKMEAGGFLIFFNFYFSYFSRMITGKKVSLGIEFSVDVWCLQSSLLETLRVVIKAFEMKSIWRLWNFALLLHFLCLSLPLPSLPHIRSIILSSVQLI